MKLKVKVKVFNNVEALIPRVITKGEWVDLKSAKLVQLNSPQAGTLKREKDNNHRDVTFDSAVIPLGVAMKLPKGFEAILAPRSSTFRTYGIVSSNSIGIIDNSYSGNNDEWKFPVIAFSRTTVNEGDRICQFRIQLSQKATVWQKLKWLFCSGIKFEIVNTLDSKDRGGFGSTGVN